MTLTCWIYSEQALSPRASETIRTILNENDYYEVSFKVLRPEFKPAKVLVFGSKAPDGVWDGVEFIHTYSIAQIMAKANAATVLTTSLQLYFNGAHEVPEGLAPEVKWDSNLARLDELGWDYDAPTVIDIETSGNLGVTHTPEDVSVISVGLYQEGKNPLVILAVPLAPDDGCPPLHRMGLDWLAEELPKFSKGIYHNGKFDTRVLNRVLGVKLCVWFDTMLAHHVLNMAAGAHGAKELAMRYLGAPDWEGDIKKYTKGGGHYERIPRDRMIAYNGWDVYWTFQLWKLFAPQIESDENNQMAFMLEMQAANMLLEVEAVGIPYSFAKSERLTQSCERVMDAELKTLRELLGNEEFKPTSPKQVKEALAKMGYHVPSTNAEEIERLRKIAEDADDGMLATFCTSLISYRKASKVKGTYSEGWGKHARGGRVHPTFLVHGTSTGRLSSTKPNAQNVPRDAKVRGMVTLTPRNQLGTIENPH